MLKTGEQENEQLTLVGGVYTVSADSSSDERLSVVPYQ